MKPSLIDTHCHLHVPTYHEDRDAVLLRMRKKNIWAITVGTTLTTSQEAIALAERQKDVFAAVGYHPEHLTSSFHDELEGQDTLPYQAKRIRELAKSSARVVAIGETGLDFFRIDADRSRKEAMRLQADALCDHIRIAHDIGLPVIMHCRDAFGELASIVQNEQRNGCAIQGVVHCFTGTWEDAKPLLDLGLYLSFTGIITFPPKKSEKPENSIRRVIERMPADRVCVETDAPWLTPVPYRGMRNEPSYVSCVANEIARLRGVSEAEIGRITTENAARLFSLPLP
ncbi:TatD family hydrolase [Patescibacteria group bacterium]|uniref:TatD family hydrolase n=1 Tax=candidate division WWE3 bacterium TaxID=2053526 RepID=A0A928TUR0_UNCKA|nr:TatD family hydrolase [candidate division WWE3 bacterium]MCL4732282.1 TatD family hydrolase [Patescibacteria group bacterium]MDL1953181.1 TatD family deoxyribonuclease [Candidatus Uhrbacteria bacterium UHB]RIL00363.1 MAG: hydrolase TatD [Candidatus Uhrbacteria bacterium]